MKCVCEEEYKIFMHNSGCELQVIECELVN